MTNKFCAAFTKINFLFFLSLTVLLLTITSLTAQNQAEAPFYQSRITADIFQFPAKNFWKVPVSPQSTITVNSTSMTINSTDGLCTLKEAIIAANTNTVSGATPGECAAGSSTGADTVSVPAGTYTLTTVDNTDPYQNSPNGLPQITGTIIVQGAGADLTKIERSSISGTPDFRIFFVLDTGSFEPALPRLTLNGSTVKNGKIPGGHFGMSYGGAIHPVGGRIEINNCRFENNTAARNGGAIVVGSADTNIINSTFTGNTADQNGGAIFAENGVIITNSTFTNNTAATGGGAIALGNNSTVAISGSTFTNNSATGDSAGGAVNGFTVNISNSIFNGNSAPFNSSNANGGAVYARFITVDQSAFTNNTTGGNGGAIGNVPTAGAFVTITNSTFSGNTAKNGGGVYGANTTIYNSTVSGNFARENGGGLIFNGSASTLNLNNTTMTNNTADSDNNGSGRGGGILHSWSFSQSQMMFIRNTIIAGNINSVAPDCADEFGGTTFSQGYNLIGNNTGCNFNSATGDQVGTSSTPINPLLGALLNNGGTGKTHALLANSPAIDTGNPNTPNGTGNNCLATDQRGAIRPSDGDENGTSRCDIGAFEVVELVPTRLAFTVQPSTTTAGQPITPAVQVSILDQFGSLIPDATNSVTIALNFHPGGGTLSGTLTKNAVNGIATFDDLSVMRAANGYNLQATSTNLTAATSSVFNITAGNPARLAFTVQPVNTNAFAIITPAIKVAVQDAAGNIVTTATNAVTIAIENNPNGNGILSGTLTRSAVNGIVTFDDLYIDQPGDGYLLLVTATGLTQAISDSFNITRPIFVVTKTADTNDGLCNSDCSLREAITAANTLHGADTINFNISGAAPFVITLSSFLPYISSSVTIDGTTQPGYNGSPIVGIRGTQTVNQGIRLDSPSNNVIRGLQFGGFDSNTGLEPAAIFIGSSFNNMIEGNYLGVDFNGNSEVANGRGIVISQGENNTIGGTNPAKRNVISGNFIGISIDSNNNTVVGNYIGTNTSGTAGLGNDIGIRVRSNNNLIGGITPDKRNIISGNTGGIGLYGHQNIIQGNYIGRNHDNTADVANGGGIFISHLNSDIGSSNLIGGTSPGAKNVISGNNYGIRIHVNYTSAPVVDNTIRGNSIYANGKLGITFLHPDYPLSNDPGDADAGANKQQNYPVLTTALLSGGNLNVQGSLNSTPNSTFTLEFFSNTACHPSGYGEGETPIGTTTVTTDGSGIIGFTAALPPVPDGSFITATATDATGNTSEFSQCSQAVGNPFSISGILTNSSSEPLAQDLVLIKLTGTSNLSHTANTNDDWAYIFSNLPDGVYTVTPTSNRYDFIPASRTYTNPVGNQTNQDFDRVRSRYKVTGVVKTNCNGTLQALRQVTLSVSGGASSGQTDANGSAIFYLPLSGSYVLTPSFGNYTFNPPSVTLPNPLTSDMTVEFIAQSPLPLCSKFVTHEGSTITGMNADGSAFAALYSAGTNAVEPDLSRDGSRLTFVESGQIYVADFDGSSKMQLTTGNAEKRLPRLSPNKTKIVYQSESRLSLFNLADNTVVTINTNRPFGDQDLEPSWSPDGTKIVFRRIHGSAGAFTHNIFSVNVDGTNLTQLTNFPQTASTDKYAYPDWSPDGSKITFTKQLGLIRSIMVINADGSNLMPLFSSSDSTLALSYPRWSPDGSKIVFVEPYSTGLSSFSRRLVVINSDGTGRIELSSGLFSSLSWAAQYQVPTPTGTNVPVQSGGVSLSFAGVSSSGQTTVNPIPMFSAGNIPGGFNIGGLAYEITTTAAYTAPISVCFTVSESVASTQAEFNALSLMHNENGTLVDRTTSRNFAAKRICGTVNSLSPFALAEEIDITKPQISGLVLDSNGNPMSGVRMFLTGEETKETETDTDGSFRFVNLTSGANYNVQPKQIGYIFNSYSQDFVNLSGEQTVVFSGTAIGFAISGRVTDSNGNGISDVIIQLNNGMIAETATDAAGNYTFPNVPADGSYTVRAFDGVNSFSPSETTVEPLLSNITNADFIQFAPTAATVLIGGRITTSDGRGIRNVRVTMTEADGTTRAAATGDFGYFRFDDVSVGQTVIINVFSQRFVFSQPTQVLTVMENNEEMNFSADK